MIEPLDADAHGRVARVYLHRARLRRLALSMRVRMCGRVSIGDPQVVVYQGSSGLRAQWHGIATCQRECCPACAYRRGAQRAADAARLVLHARGQWRMVTFTMPHNRGAPLAESWTRLLDAWRRVRSTRRVRAAYDAHVTASVRAVEVTYGRAHGWHPHLHVLLRSDEWSVAELAELEAAWIRATGARAGVGVVWSAPTDVDVDPSAVERIAAYVAKLGLELAGAGKDGSPRSVWALAERALSSRDDARAWQEYQRAIRGRRPYELDERARRLLDAAPLDEAAIEVARYSVFSEELRDLGRAESWLPDVLSECLWCACQGGPALRALVDGVVREQAARAGLARAGPGELVSSQGAPSAAPRVRAA